MANIGYVRVSTADQDLSLQLDALKAIGCGKVFEDHASGAKVERPGLAAALAYVRDGDVLMVWKLDRLGRSLPHLIEMITQLEKKGVGFRPASRLGAARLCHPSATAAGPSQRTAAVGRRQGREGSAGGCSASNRRSERSS